MHWLDWLCFIGFILAVAVVFYLTLCVIAAGLLNGPYSRKEEKREE